MVLEIPEDLGIERESRLPTDVGSSERGGDDGSG